MKKKIVLLVLLLLVLFNIPIQSYSYDKDFQLDDIKILEVNEDKYSEYLIRDMYNCLEDHEYERVYNFNKALNYINPSKKMYTNLSDNRKFESLLKNLYKASIEGKSHLDTSSYYINLEEAFALDFSFIDKRYYYQFDYKNGYLNNIKIFNNYFSNGVFENENSIEIKGRSIFVLEFSDDVEEDTIEENIKIINSLNENINYSYSVTGENIKLYPHKEFKDISKNNLIIKENLESEDGSKLDRNIKQNIFKTNFGNEYTNVTINSVKDVDLDLEEKENIDENFFPEEKEEQKIERKEEEDEEELEELEEKRKDIIFKDFTGNTYETYTVLEGNNLEPPKPPTHSEYDFIKWDENLKDIKNDMTVYPIADANIYTVTFKDWNGSIIKKGEYEYGTMISKPQPPQRENYRFVGWSQNINKVRGNSTITAEYSQSDFIVSFRDEKNNVIKNKVVEKGEDVIPPPIESKEGYTFSGWDKELTNITKDLVVHPVYIGKDYTITFKDGKNIIKKDTLKYGSKVLYPEPPIKAGKEFVKWDKRIDSLTQDETVIAIYDDLKTYGIRFFDNQENVIKKVNILEKDEVIPPTPPKKNGHTFVKWDKALTNINSNLDIRPIYEKNDYKVTFKSNNSVIKEEILQYNDVVNYPEEPQKEGFIFNGWDNQVDKITKDITINATFLKENIETCSVTFLDENNELIEIKKFEKNTTASLDYVPKKEGYTFKGWNKDLSNIQEDIVT
ncbi:MAG: InlB B-repeat-containing protein, partial [Bacillota bacterium]